MLKILCYLVNDKMMMDDMVPGVVSDVYTHTHTEVAKVL